MARYVRKSPFAVVALSPKACADALDIRAEKIRDAITAGDLPAFKNGTQVRVLIVDLNSWVRDHWTRV
jgi:hypothetical protein